MVMRKGLLCMLAAGLLFATGARSAQKAPADPVFQVATVKPSPLTMAKLMAEVRAGRMPRLGPHIDGALATYTYMSLKGLIANAFGVKGYEIVGPAWLNKERFDIQAKIPDGVSKDEAPKMLQALLKDRFKLAAHRDTKQEKVLALVVAKNGPKLKKSPLETSAVDMNAPLKPGQKRMKTPNGPVLMTKNADGSTTMNMGKRGTVTMKFDPQARTMTLQSSKVTMAGFAGMLTNMLRMGGGSGRQVVDRTGLKGNYQVALTLSMAALMAAARAQGMVPPKGSTSGQGWGASPGLAPSEPGGTGESVFASVKKLGLKLEPRKGKVEELVIDHIEKTPTAN